MLYTVMAKTPDSHWHLPQGKCESIILKNSVFLQSAIYENYTEMLSERKSSIRKSWLICRRHVGHWVIESMWLVGCK